MVQSAMQPIFEKKKALKKIIFYTMKISIAKHPCFYVISCLNILCVLDPENYEPFCGRRYPVFTRTRSHGRCRGTWMGK